MLKRRMSAGGQQFTWFCEVCGYDEEEAVRFVCALGRRIEAGLQEMPGLPRGDEGLPRKMCEGGEAE